MADDYVRITGQQTLSDAWYTLKKVEFDLKRRSGQWQHQSREVYDRGNGATILLYDPGQRTVLLTRQFRIPAHLNGHDGYLIEAAAGMLDDASPEDRIRAEVEEETGYRVGEVKKIFDLFMSPGAVTERVHFFIGRYAHNQRDGEGGGLAEEGEDIEVLELSYEDALARVASGEIRDAKTVLLLQYLQLNVIPAQEGIHITTGQ